MKELTLEVKKLHENCSRIFAEIFAEEQNDSEVSDHISSDSKEDGYIPLTPPLKKNVKRKIFIPMADKLKGSASKRKYTDKDADKQKDNSRKGKDTGKDAEKNLESNIKEYSDGNIEKYINRGSEGLLKHSSKDSDSSYKKALKNCRVRYNFFGNITTEQGASSQGLVITINLKTLKMKKTRNYLLMILKKKN